jgi:hypothetical protein
LPPGDYDLQVALGDGRNFGRAEAPLVIGKYGGKRLTLSSVMLCKRFRLAAVAAKEAAAGHFAPEFVPLVSQGIRFTPAADTRFKKSDPFIGYFQVYEPLLARRPAVKVEVHMAIADAKNGKTVEVFRNLDAAAYERPGSSTIPIARKIPIAQLPKGAYRLEVWATDSAGGSTAKRTADFTVQ